MSDGYDVVVIGGGPGGYVAAIRAGQFGLRTALVEKNAVGGVCLNEGCIPSKALIHAAESYHSLAGMKSFGVGVGEASLDWAKTVAWKDRIVKRLTTGVKTLLQAANVDLVPGVARFIDANTIEVGGETSQRLTTRHTILATGSVPIEVPSLRFDGETVISSRELLALTEVPRRLIVVGGGYIGMELGTVMAMAGSEVTIVELLDDLLAGQPRDAVQVVERNLRRLKIKAMTGTKADKLEIVDGVAKLTVVDKDGATQELTAEKVLVTVGRRPYDGGVGLDVVGLERDEKGFLPVDAQRRTAHPAIYAIGDLVPGPMLAHKASAEAVVAAAAIAGKEARFTARAVPGVVFTYPEIATVGLSEAAAQARGIEAEAASFPYQALGRALTMGTSDGYFKWIYRTADKVVLGAEICGREASNLIAEAGLVVERELTLEDVAHTIHAHPILAEGLHEAAELGLGWPVHVPKK